MNIATILVCGIVGTAIMTSFLTILFYFKDRKFRIVRILGSLLTSAAKKIAAGDYGVVTVGTIVHYTIGIIFCVPYVWLWTNQISSPTVFIAILYGAINGVVAVIVWRFLIAINSRPPYLPLTFFLTSVGISHIFFGLGILAAYQFMNS